MLHDTLAEYLGILEKALTDLENAYVEDYLEEILTSERINIRFRIRYASGYLLEINEAIVVEQGGLLPLDYRYHCQDGNNRLVFRYDSAPHFPNLSTFPHHKHLPDNTIAAEKPSLLQVLNEAERHAKQIS